MSAADLGRRPDEVASMFDAVARRYDLLNALMTGGRDRSWRREVLRAVAPRPGQVVLDLATGTGTSAVGLATAGVRVVGVDFSPGMLAQGVRRGVPERGVHLVAADALHLPLADASVDAVAVSFGLRNVVDLDAALAEALRVTRPGGRLVVCETSRPHASALRAGHRAWLLHGLPALARISSSGADAYRYLAASTLAWPDGPALARRLAGAGWRRVRWKPLTLGVVALHVGVRPR